MLRLSEILKKYKGLLKKTPVPEEIEQEENETALPEKPSSESDHIPIKISPAICKSFSKIESNEIFSLYEEILARVKHIYLRGQEECFVPWIKELIEKILQVLFSPNKEALLRLSVKDYDKEEDYLYAHALNVCIMSLEIGRSLGYEREQLLELGIAAFVHDIGIVKYLDIINKNYILGKEEMDKIKNHPNLGSQILTRFSKDLNVSIIEAVRQEHERIDGSGYPLGLKGEQISEYARIIGLLDVYEALLHKRPHRQKYTPLEAIQKILELKETFDNKLIKVLMERMGIFPIGVAVRLNTKEIGTVIKENPQLPLRPVVEVVLDSTGKRLTQPKQIDLSQKPEVYIEECLKECLF
ncbi:MAG: HD domain-containing protein [Candidatus Omnitrophica bacterium]|nr:HD domain-containing protein [Candidatus Omnitrophota bacterium]